jgi:hypothetical protein
MTRYFLPLVAIVLTLASCEADTGTGSSLSSYPSITYTNDSPNWDITVKNAARETYTLEKGQSSLVHSDVRGRGDIIEIKPVYVTWVQNKGNMYDIRFIDREKIELEIHNYAPADIELTEESGYLYPLLVKVGAASGPDSPPSLSPGKVYVYTDKPVFELLSGSWQIKSKKSGDKLIVAINPPAGWK